jgi:hypothetical protein
MSKLLLELLLVCVEVLVLVLVLVLLLKQLLMAKHSDISRLLGQDTVGVKSRVG